MQTLGEWYLSNANGDLVRYHQGLRAGHRLGQAFFNALNRNDQERIRGTLWDPFNKHSSMAVEKAVEFLTTKE